MKKLILIALVCASTYVFGQQDSVSYDTITVRPNHQQLLTGYVKQIEDAQTRIQLIEQQLQALKNDVEHVQDKIFLISSMYTTEPPRTVTKDGKLIVYGNSN